MKTTIENFTKVDCNSSGNPRYVCHFLRLVTDAESNQHDVSTLYNIALHRAKKLGGKKYHNKSYGGGIAFATFSLDDTVREINELMEKEKSAQDDQ